MLTLLRVRREARLRRRPEFDGASRPPQRAGSMVFKLVEAAHKSWRRLDGNNQLSKLILGVKFADGLEVVAKPANPQPTTVAA
jgi:hypothetical protein